MEPTTPPPVATAPAGATVSTKADPVKRFVAYLIDALIAAVPAWIFGTFSGMLAFVFYLAGGAYLLVRDGLTLDFANGRSIGKQVMKLRPQTLDGMPMDMMTSVKRNWPLALPSIFWGVAALLAAGAVASNSGAGFGAGMAGAGLFGILGMLSSLLVLVECIMVLVDSEGRRLGDKTGNTKVIETAE